jgi:hypothetical protein
MQEKISRYASTGGVTRTLDSFDADVSIADGVEQYTDVKGPHRSYRHVTEISGLWSFGEIVTMLRTTRDIIESSATNRIEDDPVGTVIRFQTPASNHQWFVMNGGRIYWLAFEGAIRISGRTGEIERVTWTSRSGLSGTGIASILWEVSFATVNVAGDACSAPSASIYRVVRTGVTQPAEWNLTRYVALDIRTPGRRPQPGRR